MSKFEKLEHSVALREYQWLLEEEVHSVLRQVHDILLECSKRFPLNHDTYSAQENLVRPQKFMMSSTNADTNIKCMVTLIGDLICEADITIKNPKDPKATMRTAIQASEPWRLQQIQDAGNHLTVSLDMVTEKLNGYEFKTGHETIAILNSIMGYVSLARQSILLPRPRSLEELVNNPQLKTLSPAIPSESALSFYVHGQKLMLASYHLLQSNNNRWDMGSRQQVECTVPWLNECIVFLTIALQIMQQLRSKLKLFQGCENGPL